MPDDRTIQTSRPPDLITQTILVDGQELSSGYQVLNIVVEKEINRISRAKIIMLDGDAASQDFELSNEALFIPGKEVEIKAGYHSDEETIFKGIVIKHNLKIRSNQAMLIIECRDRAVKLTVGRKSKYFYESTDSDILAEIIGNYDVDSQIEASTVTHPELVQYNVSDWDFCISRTQAIGKICIIDDGQLAIAAPDYAQDAIQTIAFGATIFDFDAEIDARHQVSTITSYAWNPSEQAITETEAEEPRIDLNGNLSNNELSEVIGLDNFRLPDGGNINSSVLQDWANAKKVFNTLAKTRGRVKFQGIASVKPNTTLMLEGVGDRFNGKVYVSAVRHQITEGNWTVDAQFGVNPKWLTETAEINDTPASGLLAAVNGLQIAKVTQLEEDPNGEDRIMIRMPIVDNEEQGIWARVATLDAGENRGSFFRPEIDDEVIVGFINSSPNEAVVLGMLNSSAKPAPISATDDNHEKGFITRSEMKLVFDDDKKSIKIETPAGKIITVDEDEGIIKLEDEDSNIVTLDSYGIKLESQGDISLTAAGDVKIEGTNIELSANAEFKANGSAGSEVKSSAVTKVEGSLVQIN